ncbi:MAG: ABC transporter, substrate-binding protein (cluster 1, maltose/g3p/polyamine/iron) [uncultured Friedmanniella sp.]|uniref:ABC transporter, substrate-binding protein (Cluster 1, maltose/g3p/polyamine/iron) n=1 Tax=uncultured Friedmanniella sp. TaxID=335381 RepID=A0A6J4KX31_9ACTN|nr:MAG: ABC transporter, substrate-binding protein (cluster 1, maltose/g3p/polyamine/iron) [uncultured Friedmanniella sp.]
MIAMPSETSGSAFSRRRFLSTTTLTGVGLAGSGSLLAACGGGSSGGPQSSGGGGGGGGQSGGNVTWASWANPGEAERFKKYSTDYASRSGAKVTYQTVVEPYAQKIVTQLAGAAGPDAFYVGDNLMAKVIQSGQVIDLSEYLNSDEAAIKEADIYPGLMKWVKKDGSEGVYGLPVDCNPKVFWFNKKLLADAGVTQDPAAMQEAGTWNQAALDDLLTKVKASGKRGMLWETSWFDICGWITTFGGKAVDDTGKVIFDTDPGALEVLDWLFQHLGDETITFTGALPKGQNGDALFYASQVASVQFGRWILPNVKKLKNFEYDIAPLPSKAGNEISETAVYCAAMSVNSKSDDIPAATRFAGEYVSQAGQKFRLSGGGNAVPCVDGIDEVVTEGNLPAHGAYFSQVAKKGYTTPQVLVENPEVASSYQAKLQALVLEKPDYKTFATKAANLMNGKG